MLVSNLVANSHARSIKRWTRFDRLALGYSLAFVSFGEQTIRDLSEEAARRVVVRRPEQVPGGGMGEIQVLLRSRDPHVCQSTFFFELVGVTQGPHVREDTFLHPGDEDHRELETLGVVKGHQRDRTRFLHPIDVRNQRRRLEEEFETAAPAEFLPLLVTEICHRSVLFELACDRQQLL